MIISLWPPYAVADYIHFLKLLSQVKNYSLLGPQRLKNLSRFIIDISKNSVSGDIVECGVWNGGSAAVMYSTSKKTNQNREIWLYDSFEGMPRSTDCDGIYAKDAEGTCKGEIYKVKEIFSNLGILDSGVHIIKGWFHEIDQLPNRISLLHIDADWYESVKTCLEKFYDLVSPGGCIVFDDYGDCGWEGCTRAVDEFLEQKKLNNLLKQSTLSQFYFKKV